MSSRHQWLTLEREDVRLAVLDFGGEGKPALLLHGLAGDSEEWKATAAWLRQQRRVFALDSRGHGRSERAPRDVSPAARIADVAFVIEQLELGPVLLLGQSLGGLLALQVASRHPALVEALVIAEAGPTGAGRAGAAAKAADVESALSRWRTPLSRSEIELMGRMLSEAIADDHWEDWSRIRCPTLVVRGANGALPIAEARRMVAAGQRARLIELADAGHELHLEGPEAWERAVREFSNELRR
jgi:pimeloyl-ACP methyl ester carboxylesterase